MHRHRVPQRQWRLFTRSREHGRGELNETEAMVRERLAVRSHLMSLGIGRRQLKDVAVGLIRAFVPAVIVPACATTMRN